MNIEMSTVVNRPPDEVFAFVTDARNQSQWEDDLIELRQIPDGPAGLGTTITETRTFLGRRIESSSEVIEYDPPKRYARRGTKPFPLTGYLTFEPVEGGTRLTWRWEGQPGGFFALAQSVIVASFKKGGEEALSRMKSILESESVNRA